MVGVSSDVVADGIVQTMRTWMSASASSWGGSNGVEWSKSILPRAAFFNVIFARGTDVSAADLDAAAATFFDPDWNFRVEARPETLEVVEDWARANGRERQPEELSWLLTDPGALDVCRDTAKSGSTRSIGPAEMHEHRKVLLPVFQMDPANDDFVSTDALAAVPGVFFRVAHVDGVPAGTAMSIVTDTGGIGVFAVAVGEQFRRLGIGREVTAAVIGDGLEYGGSWSFLEASDEGRGIYQRMGFQPIDGWHSFRVPKPAEGAASDA
jgi:ribosomal protein S18 acetylase RimI-like enzyme